MPPGLADVPVTWLGLYEARAYCKWAHGGSRLPHRWGVGVGVGACVCGRAARRWDASWVHDEKKCVSVEVIL